MTARPTAEEIVQMLRPELMTDELMNVHGHTLVMAEPEEDDEDDEYGCDEYCDCENCYEPEPDEYEHDDYFPCCPRCGLDWEYVGTSTIAKCEGGHEWQEVA